MVHFTGHSLFIFVFKVVLVRRGSLTAPQTLNSAMIHTEFCFNHIRNQNFQISQHLSWITEMYQTVPCKYQRHSSFHFPSALSLCEFQSSCFMFGNRSHFHCSLWKPHAVLIKKSVKLQIHNVLHWILYILYLLVPGVCIQIYKHPACMSCNDFFKCFFAINWDKDSYMSCSFTSKQSKCWSL